MKKLFAMLLVGGVLATAVVGCGPAAAPSSNPPPPAVNDKTATGKVTKADKDSITIKVDDKDQTYKVDSSTKVTIDGKDDKAENVKADNTATVTYKDSTATKIEAKTK